VREDEIVVLRRKVDTGMGEKDPVRKVSNFFFELIVTIEIGLKRTPFLVFVYFFPHLNMQKNLLIMGPNNTKNSSKSAIFS
jgi:hypothetical protein